MLKKALAVATVAGALFSVAPAADAQILCVNLYLYADGELVNTGDVCTPA